MRILLVSNLIYYQDMMKKLKHSLKNIFMMPKKSVISLMVLDILIFVIHTIIGYVFISKKVT